MSEYDPPVNVWIQLATVRAAHGAALALLRRCLPILRAAQPVAPSDDTLLAEVEAAVREKA